MKGRRKETFFNAQCIIHNGEMPQYTINRFLFEIFFIEIVYVTIGLLETVMRMFLYNAA